MARQAYVQTEPKILIFSESTCPVIWFGMIGMATGKLSKAEDFFMQIKIYFKTPDAVDYAIEDLNLSEDQEIQAREIIKKWVNWGEEVCIQIDLETEEAIVLPAL